MNIPSFSDKRVFLVRTNDTRCASFWDETRAGSEQDDDGPTHLVIGKNAPDAALHRLAKRYPYSFDELRAFRDGSKMRAETLAA